MDSSHTQPETQPQAALPEGEEALALVILWAPQDPHLPGSCLFPVEGGACVFGRGDAPPEDGSPRALPRRLRPGHTEVLGSSTNGRLSRSQLRISALGKSRLLLESVGLCPLVWRGQEVPRCEVQAGEVVALGHQMILLCAARPRLLPGAYLPSPFGLPDELGLVGESPAIFRLRREIAFLAQRDEHTLVLGPSGSGKELVARALHLRGKRSHQPWVSRNAATIPETLVDAELFGNAKNYPNPGMADRPGLIGQASGGTLFLDEFAELPQGVQTHLLRVLDGGEYQRLGEATTRRSDFRLIAATNRPIDALKEDVAARFLLRLTLPGLDERKEDIPLLLRHLLRGIAARDLPAVQRFFPGGDPAAEPRLSRDLVLALVHRSYSTHLRELTSLLWDSIRNSTADELLPDQGWDPWPVSPALSSPSVSSSEPSATFLQKLLDDNNGSLEKTWRAAGLPNRYALRRLILKYDLEVRRQLEKKP